jgi:ABC-type transport system involved in multi-copper enzyme maturation permease subunit
MTRLIAAEFRKLLTTRLWLWILLLSAAWTILYTSLYVSLDKHSGKLGPSLATAAGQHSLFAIAAGGAGTLVAVMAMAQVAGEYRHRTVVTTFLATPHRQRFVIAQVITFLLAGVAYALVCIVINLAVALPWAAANGIHVSAMGNGNAAVLAAVVIAAALFGITGVGLGALLHSQLAAVTVMLLYLYVLEPLLSHIASLNGWTPYLPGVAADGLTQAIQTGVRLLSPWAGGVVFAAWAVAFVAAGTARTVRRDIT